MNSTPKKCPKQNEKWWLWRLWLCQKMTFNIQVGDGQLQGASCFSIPCWISNRDYSLWCWPCDLFFFILIRSHSGGNLVCLFFSGWTVIWMLRMPWTHNVWTISSEQLVQTGCVPGPGWCVFVCFVKFCICIHHTITTHHRNKLWICFFLWYGAEVMVQPRRVFVKFGSVNHGNLTTQVTSSKSLMLILLTSRKLNNISRYTPDHHLRTAPSLWIWMVSIFSAS